MYAPPVASARLRRAIVGLALGGSLLVAACGRNTGAGQATTALPSVHVASALIVSHPIPAWDLEAAGLTAVADLITPLQISSVDNGRTITLIAAYADVARTVLVFRENPPDLGLPSVIVSDDQGMINAGSSAGPVRSPGVRSDYYVALDDGARPGADGLAHLSIAISHLNRWTPAGGIVDGNWAFTVALTVQPGQSLPAPNQFRLRQVRSRKLALRCLTSGHDRFCHGNMARNFWYAGSRLAVHSRVARAEEKHPPVSCIAELVGFARFQQHGIELLQHEFFVRRADRALAFENHEYMIVVFMVMHVVLQLRPAVDHPEIS